MNEPKSAAKPTNKFDCTICPKSFASASNLENHISNKHIDDKDKAFPCTKCLETKKLEKFFGSQRVLNKHISQVHRHGPLSFKCQVCLKTFKGLSTFTGHKRIHSQTNMNIHKCHLCHKAFPVNSRLHYHLFHVHKLKLENVKYLKCELCTQEFAYRSNLERHVVSNHVVDKAFECLVCSLKFINQEALEKHLKTHDRPRSHICDVCSKGFIQRNGLITHLGINHSHFFHCDRCLTSFKNKLDFDNHRISDLNQEIKCSLCLTLLVSECNLKIHTASHVNEIKTDKKDNINVDNQIEHIVANKLNKSESTIDLNFEKPNFQCELCSKIFDREEYFRIHRKLIHPNAEWKCNFDKCFKSFKAYYLLKYHKMDHLKAKLFVCNICQISFNRPDNLKKHKQCHIQEKKYKCDQCPNSYGKPYALRTHVAMKHGGPKLFKCPEVDCGKSWTSSTDLKRHLISHETVKLFKCKVCTPIRDFKYIHNFKNHQRRVHSDTENSNSQQLLSK